MRRTLAAVVLAALSFPRDHGSHPDAAVEWWYYTGHLADARGRAYGFQLTFFRVRELHLAHFAWTDVARRQFRYEEKAHLALPGIATADEGRLQVTNEDWSAREEPDGVHALAASGGEIGELSLRLTPSKPPVLHGAAGLSRKGPGAREFSRYVSITRFAARGTIRRNGRPEALTGTAWFDHEWGPGVLPAAAVGWDWFALQLDDPSGRGGSELMLYRLRRADGTTTPFSSGTFVPARGDVIPIRWGDVRLAETSTWTSPRSRARYPARWRVSIAPVGLDVEITPLLPDQELETPGSTGVTYWEGACSVRGTRGGKPVAGRAYVELTGYAGRDVPGLADER